MFLKPATKGHIVHLANNYLKRTIQEHTISWKLHPESSVVCLFITLADEARQYESCIEIGIKQPRLSWTGTGEKEERRERKMRQVPISSNCGKEQKVWSTDLLLKTRVFKAAAPASATSHLVGGKILRMLRNSPCWSRNHCCTAQHAFFHQVSSQKHYLTCIFNIKMQTLTANN